MQGKYPIKNLESVKNRSRGKQIIAISFAIMFSTISGCNYNEPNSITTNLIEFTNGKYEKCISSGDICKEVTCDSVGSPLTWGIIVYRNNQRYAYSYSKDADFEFRAYELNDNQFIITDWIAFDKGCNVILNSTECALVTTANDSVDIDFLTAESKIIRFKSENLAPSIMENHHLRVPASKMDTIKCFIGSQLNGSDSTFIYREYNLILSNHLKNQSISNIQFICQLKKMIYSPEALLKIPQSTLEAMFGVTSIPGLERKSESQLK